jgi:hypothetical protein
LYLGLKKAGKVPDYHRKGFESTFTRRLTKEGAHGYRHFCEIEIE